MATSPSRRRPLKPPPNYNSRGVQLRLFVMVACVMGLLYLVTERARSVPWPGVLVPVGSRVGVSADAKAIYQSRVDELVDTRLDRLPTDEAQSSIPDGVQIVDPYGGVEPSLHDGVDLLQLIFVDGWSAFYQSLPVPDRMLFSYGLTQALEEKSLGPQQATAWQDLLKKGDTFWSGYRHQAMQSVTAEDSSLSVDEQRNWEKMLDEVGQGWLADRAVLERLIQPPPEVLTSKDRERLQRMQTRWQKLALIAVQDDTVSRPEDSDAWFGLLAALRKASPTELSQPVPEVTYLQLFKQPQDYRGELVRIRGRIKRAKPIESRENLYGIDKQYILWLEPSDGSPTPIVVYTLQLPEGFPSLDQPNLDDGYTKLWEDVEINGYFLKRWAYRAHDGINTVPLLLTKEPQWYPSANVGARADGLPSAWLLLASVLGTALFGIVVAAVVYGRTSNTAKTRQLFAPSPEQQQDVHTSLAKLEAGPNVLESLKKLEARDRQADEESSS